MQKYLLQIGYESYIVTVVEEQRNSGIFHCTRHFKQIEKSHREY